MPIRQDRPRGNPVKTEYASAKAAALAETDEEAVEISLPAHLRMAAKRSAAIFCGSVRRTVPQKPEGLKQAVGQTARFRNAGARGQGERGSLWRS